jgi:hypothetical protein
MSDFNCPISIAKEIVMSKRSGSASAWKVIEQVFAGIVFISMVAFVVVGTIAMCLPSATFLI